MKKYICLGILIPAATIGAWMLWPRPMENTINPTHEFSISTANWIWNQKRANYDIETENFTLEANSEEGEAIHAILSNYSYHPCLDTVTGNDTIHDIGTIELYICGRAPTDKSSFTESLTLLSQAKFRYQGRIYRIGYFGNGQGEQLAQELYAYLQSTK